MCGGMEARRKSPGPPPFSALESCHTLNDRVRRNVHEEWVRECLIVSDAERTIFVIPLLSLL
jgi:hypothetical protein